MKGYKDIKIALLKKETQQPSRRELFLTEQPCKPKEESSEKDNADLEILQRMVKKISN